MTTVADLVECLPSWTEVQPDSAPVAGLPSWTAEVQPVSAPVAAHVVQPEVPPEQQIPLKSYWLQLPASVQHSILSAQRDHADALEHAASSSSHQPVRVPPPPKAFPKPPAAAAESWTGGSGGGADGWDSGGSSGGADGWDSKGSSGGADAAWWADDGAGAAWRADDGAGAAWYADDADNAAWYADDVAGAGWSAGAAAWVSDQWGSSGAGAGLAKWRKRDGNCAGGRFCKRSDSQLSRWHTARHYAIAQFERDGLCVATALKAWVLSNPKPVKSTQ